MNAHQSPKPHADVHALSIETQQRYNAYLATKQERDEAIRQAIANGESMYALAKLVGISQQSIAQIRDQEDYFTKKARQAMTKAGAPDADFTSIADWARDAHNEADQDAGIIVDADGTIHAHTGRTTDDLGMVTIFIKDHKAHGIGANVLDMGIAELSKKLGRRLVHLTYYDLTTGPGQ